MDDFFINPARMDALRARLLACAAGNHPKAGWLDDNYTPPDGNAPLVYETTNGVALIPVRGTLASVQLPDWSAYGDITYEQLIATIEKAIDDPAVEQLMLSIMSPGGTVTGCAAAAARLDKLADQKPLWAHCSMADSAAYWLASAANRIIVDPTGEVGSIGVIMTHVDVTKLLADWGYKVTHIHSGAHKADGSPYMPLSDSAKARLQADLDYLRGEFVASVASYRDMDRQALMDTEALTYKGRIAVENGLADETGFLADVLGTMPERAARLFFTQPNAKKENSMAKKKLKDETAEHKKPVAAAEDQKDDQKADPADEDDADDDQEGDGTDENEGAGEKKAEKTTPSAAATPAGGEKARIAAILGCEQAKGREKLAQHLALNTDLSAENAIATLGAAEKEQKPAGNPLAAAMRTNGSPDIGADAPAKAGNANPLLATTQKFRPGQLRKAG